VDIATFSANPHMVYILCALHQEQIELSKKYVQKKKLRANFIKTGISTSQRAKGNLVVFETSLKQALT
jgi:hypothetical protein